jgi:hypothetical protein
LAAWCENKGGKSEVHDLAFITQIRDEPVALTVLAGLVLLKICTFEDT